MPNNNNDFLGAYLDLYGVTTKQQQVDEASRRKQEQLRRISDPQGAYEAMVGENAGYGAATADEAENDLRTLSPMQLEAKYGQTQAAAMIRARVDANSSIRYAKTTPRSGSQIVSDALNAAVGGVVSGVGGIAALGAAGLSKTGVIDEAVPVNLARNVQAANDVVNDFKSDPLKAQQDYVRAGSNQAKRDRDALYKERGEGIYADLGRIGREFIDSATMQTSMGGNVGDIIAQAAGSLVTGSVVGKGLTELGAGLVSRKAGQVAAIGVQEAGGYYQQNAVEAYELLAERDDLSEDQRIQLANNAGLLAAAIQAPVAIATGMLVAKFEANPLKFSPATAVDNIIKETVEEGIQSASGNIAGNAGIQTYADPNRTLLEGTGEDVVAGMIGGAGSAGAMQVPGAALTTTAETAKAGVASAKMAAALGQSAIGAVGSVASAVSRPIVSALAKRGQKIEAAAEAEASAFTNQAAREQVDRASSFVGKLQEAMDAGDPDAITVIQKLAENIGFDPASLSEDTPPEILEALSQEGDTLSALDTLSEIIANNEPGTDLHTAAARIASGLYQKNAAALEFDQELLDTLPDDSRTRTALNELTAAMTAIRDSDVGRQTNEASAEAIVTAATQADDLTDQGNASTVADAAELRPGSITADQARTVLKHHSDGTIVLAPNQIAALKTSAALLEAERAALKEHQVDGKPTEQSLVSKDILGKNGMRGYTTLSEHARGILSAYKAGNTEEASTRLQSMLNFAQHMQNKLASLNASFEGGTGNQSDAPAYNGWDGTRWAMQPGAYVNVNAQSTIRFAQTIAQEAAIAAEVANRLVDIFPDLDVAKVAPVALNPELQGTTKEVRVRAKAKRMQAKAGSEAPAAKPVAEAKPSAPVAPANDNVEAKSTPTPVVSRVTPELAASASDAKLQTSIDRYFDRVEKGVATDEDKATFDVLNAEMTAREDRIANEERIAQETEQQRQQEADYIARAEEAQRLAEGLPEPDTKTEETVVEEPAEEQLEADDAPSTEPTPEPQAAVDPVEPVASVEAAPETDVAPTGLRAHFSNLLGNTVGSPFVNYFLDAFRYKKAPTSRLTGIENPIEYMMDTIEDTDLVAELTGIDRERINETVVESWQQELGSLIDLKDRLNARLQEAVSKAKPAKLLRFTRFEEGRVLNLAEGSKADARYNNELVETALIGALQWAQTATRYIGERDADAVRKMLGVSDADKKASKPADLEKFELAATQVNANLREFMMQLSGGLTLVEAVNSLSNSITRYWGLDTNKSMAKGHVEGIPEAMAKEILTVMIDAGIIKKTSPVANIVGGQGLILKRPDIYVINRLPPGNGVLQMPDLIEQITQMKPERINYVGKPPEDVPETQHNQPRVKNTPMQKKALRNRMNNKFTLNLPMLSFYESMTDEDFINTFGGGDVTDVEAFNAVDLETLKGRNVSAQSALKDIKKLVAEMRAEADVKGTALNQIPVFFRYNFTKNNRLMMQGPSNPQTSKLMRELLLPTWAKVDMTDTNGAGYRGFMLAMAQHLGVKVELLKPDVTIQTITDQLTKPTDDGGKFNRAVSVLQDWLNTDQQKMSPKLIAILKGELGGELAPSKLHALMEFARFQNASPEEQANFETALYLEADGKTNGPINALNIFTAGGYDPKWLANALRGGLSFGSEIQTLADSLGRVNNADLYQAAADALKSNVTLFQDKLKGTAFAPQMDHLMMVLQTVLGSDVEFDGQNLIFKRGVTKSPVTTSIYGAGLKGISEALTHELTTGLASLMTKALQAKLADPSLSDAGAMFPGDATADAKYTSLVQALEALTNKAAFIMKGEMVWTKANGRMPAFDLRAFKLDGKELSNLTRNVQTFFVGTVKESVDSVLGNELKQAMTQIQQATQSQGLVLGALFQKAVSDRIEARAAADPSYLQTEGLSQAELDEIWETLLKYAPIMETAEQNLLVSGTDRADDKVRRFSTTLTGKMATPAFFNAPTNPGVAGIPAMVIGSGDGVMMLLYALSQDAVNGTLDVFDGLNMPVDKIEEYSRAANKAVLDSWQRNPTRTLADNYARFVSQLKLSELDITTLNALSAMFPPAEGETKAQGIRSGIAALRDGLENSARDLEAKKKAMARVSFSVDQMASGSAPYFNNGDVSIETNDLVEVAQVLQDLTNVERDKIEKTSKDKATYGVDPVVSELGEQLAVSQAWVVPNRSLGELGRRLGATKWQQRLIKDMTAPLETKGYSLVVGSKAQLLKFMEENGVSDNVMTEFLNAKGKTSGMTLPGLNLILIENSSPEVILHEMIHGATFDTINDYYAGRDLGMQATRLQLAITNIEKLMNQFLDLDVSAYPPKTATAYADATRAINQFQSAGDMAGALNEFMAWGLSNQELIQTLRDNEASPLARMAAAVVAFIKQVVWGNKSSPDSLNDMLSNLRFNSTVISELAGRTMMTDLTDRALYHSSTYGTDEFVERIDRVFNEKLARFLSVNNVGIPAIDEARMKREVVNLTTRTNRVAAAVSVGFGMTAQQKTTFQTIHAVMGSLAQIDANALSRAADLFDHANKTLKVEDFLKNDGTDAQADFYQASQKYNLIFSAFGAERDAQGRSSLLPTFLATALVSEEFRNILKKLPMPRAQKNKSGTFDGWVENLGIDAMDALGRQVSGEGRTQPHVQAAIAALTETLLETAQERQSFYDRFVGPLGSAVDNLNQNLVDAIQRAAVWTFKKAGDVSKSTSNSKVKVAAQATRSVAAFFDKNLANQISESWVGMMNRSEIPEIAKKLVTDMVGRTTSNAGVYDLIKRVRAEVQQRRQEYRETLPKYLQEKFKRKVSEAENAAMFKGLGKTDIVSLLSSMKMDDLINLLANPTGIMMEIQKTEQAIKALDPAVEQRILLKSRQLATFMMTGKASAHQLRNATAVADLAGDIAPKGYTAKAGMEQLVDKLVSLYAYADLPSETQDTIADLATNEAEGIEISLALLGGMRKTEMGKILGKMDKYNHYKGYFPSEQAKGGSIVVQLDSKRAQLEKQSFVRVGDYAGSSLEPSAASKGYYYVPVSTRATYAQGLLQMVQHTVGGVDRWSGLTHGRTVAGEVWNPSSVARASRNRHRETGNEPLLPVMDENGMVTGYERSVDPVMLEMVPHAEDFFAGMGMWAGRQVEEREARGVNQLVLQKLNDMYQNDIRKTVKNRDQYINLFDDKVLDRYPTLRDTMENMPGETIFQIRGVFGNEFMVRKDMLDDAMGYRKAGVRDLWSGISNWTPKQQDQARQALVGVFGKKAYQRLVTAEAVLSNLVTDAKVLVVVKSMVVPMVNLLANVYQLAGRGVPLNKIAVGFPKKAAEINDYLRTREQELKLKADMRAAKAVGERERIRAEIQSIQDRHRRMSIWPLIEAGEFTSISDATLTHEELTLSEGRLSDYLDRAVEKLPAPMMTAAKYGMVSRDTALFRGMQRAVQYGDFVAKAVLYEDLLSRQKKTPEQAMAAISDEFVNYDRLPGRSRGYLEDIGLIWFWHFKIRSVKIAMSMMRNNPLHVILSGLAPRPDLFGSIGTPVTDNILTSLAEGRLDSSIGYDMLFRAPGLNPVYNALS